MHKHASYQVWSLQLKVQNQEVATICLSFSENYSLSQTPLRFVVTETNAKTERDWYSSNQTKLFVCQSNNSIERPRFFYDQITYGSQGPLAKATLSLRLGGAVD